MTRRIGRRQAVLETGAAALALAAGAPARSRAQAAPDRWAVVYTSKVDPAALKEYSLLVLDSKEHPPLRGLIEQGKTLLGYISLGEVERFRPWYRAVEAEGILLDRNPHWPESRYVDVRDRRWTRRVLEDLVPQILLRGFHGIFLDTLDNPADLERREPERFKGMTAASAALVKALRRHFPRAPIMMNRAYEILPTVEGDITSVLGESVFADFDFEAKRYRLVEAALYRRQVEILQAARSRQTGLKVFTLDYWDPEDRAGIARIYTEQRRNGFAPYVSVLKLDRIVPEPDR
jgi:polysaccharide biosynthesis protein PelA